MTQENVSLEKVGPVFCVHSTISLILESLPVYLEGVIISSRTMLESRSWMRCFLKDHLKWVEVFMKLLGKPRTKMMISDFFGCHMCSTFYMAIVWYSVAKTSGLLFCLSSPFESELTKDKMNNATINQSKNISDKRWNQHLKYSLW